MTLYQDAVIADAPLVYFKLDDLTQSGSSSTASLTLGAGATITSDGIGSNALTLNGSGTTSFASVTATRTNFATPSMTYEFWVKTTGTVTRNIARWGTEGTTTNFTIKARSTGAIGFTWRTGGAAGDASSTATVNDGNWHHVAITLTSSTITFYIDGVSSGTGSIVGTQANTSATFYLGSNASSDSFTGAVDEFAVYNKILTGTQIAAHKTAGTVTNVDVTVDTPTASFTGIEPTVLTPVNVSTTVPTATLSALANDVTVETHTVVKSNTVPSIDGTWNVAGGFDNTINTDMRIQRDGSTAMVMGFTYPAGVTNMNQLVLNMRGVGSTGTPPSNIRIYAIEAPWAADSTSLTLSSAYLEMGWTFLASPIDVKTLIDPSKFYGIYIDTSTPSAGTGTIAANSKESAFPSYLYMDYDYAPVAVDLTVTSPTLSVLSNEATVSVNVSTTLDTGLFSVLSYDAEAEVGASPTVTVDVETSTFEFKSIEAEVSNPIDLIADVAPFTMDAYEADVEVTTNVEVANETGKFTVVAYKPSEVNGEEVGESDNDDRYFVETSRRLPALWFRGDKQTGNILANRGVGLMSAQGGNQMVNVGGSTTIGVRNGIDGRATMTFDGTDFLRQIEAPQELTYDQRSMEFTIRTNKADSFLFGGIDNYGSGLNGGTVAGETGFIDFSLVGGKITESRNGDPLFTGFKNIADGNWHHVVITARSDSNFGLRGVIEVWIDGKLDIRRRSGTGNPEYTTFGYPDFVGGRTSQGVYQVYENRVVVKNFDTNVASGNWFVGDLTELVYYEYLLNEDDILAQYDAMFGYVPVRPDTGRFTVKSNEATVKSNKTRMLWIDFQSGDGGRTQPFDAGMMRTIRPSYTLSGSRNSLNNAVGLYGVPYLFFFTGALNHLDEVTDEMRILDLEKDLNMDDYDAIGFVGYPATSDERKDFVTFGHFGGNGQAEWDRLMEQIKQQIINGKNVVISDANIASDLGFITDVEFVSGLKEALSDYSGRGNGDASPSQGDTPGKYDAQAATINPFGEPKAPQGQSRNYAGRWYFDTHSNDKYRVRNLVAGLTDIPSFIFTDAIAYSEPTSYADDWNAFKYANRMNGLNVGDEFYFQYLPDGERIDQKFGGFLATPVSAVKAGTVVTTFGARYYSNDMEMENINGNIIVKTSPSNLQIKTNPYAEFATVITLSPGQKLPDGRVVAGKVFIDFTEPTNRFTAGNVLKQIVPSNEEQMATLPQNQWHLETPEQREWDYSYWRGQRASLQLAKKQKYVLNADGTIGAIDDGADPIQLSTYSGWWPVVSLPLESMISRGFKWISKEEELNGNTTVGVETATFSVDAKAVTVNTTRSATVDVPTGRFTMEAFTLFDVAAPDTLAVVPTPTFTLDVVQLQEVVNVETGRFSFTSYEDQGSVVDESEIISLTLLGTGGTIILNIKEES